MMTLADIESAFSLLAETKTSITNRKVVMQDLMKFTSDSHHIINLQQALHMALNLEAQLGNTEISPGQNNINCTICYLITNQENLC